MAPRRLSTILARSPAAFHALRAVLDPGQPARVRALLRDVPHTAVLELGCGIGANRTITDRPYTGLDLDPAYIAYAAKRFGGDEVRFRVGDLRAPLDPALRPIDLVALLNVVHHLSDGEVRRAVGHVRAAGATRVLVVDVAVERTGWLFRRVFGPLDRGAAFRTTDQLRALLESAGLVIEREAVWSTGPGIWPRFAFLGQLT